MVMQLRTMAFILFTHVIKLCNAVVLDIHGIEVYFCSHQCSFPAVLPPSQRCDGHEGMGGCSQQSQQDHCEWNTRTHTHAQCSKNISSIVFVVKKSKLADIDKGFVLFAVG